MKLLIKQGRVIDPDTKLDEICDLYIEYGKITKVGKDLKVEATREIDASGCYVMPGLIDLHVHLRDPGLTHKEDIETGAKAAAKGGFTTIVAMPNTKPPIDSPDRVSYVHVKAHQYAPIHVLQTGCVTKGMKGEEPADIEGMAKAGIPAITEDGKTVMNTRVYKEAMEMAKKSNIPVFAHCEDSNLVQGGCMNEDEKSKAWGLPGITNAVEDVIVARDILLAEEVGVPIHLCHCSTKNCYNMVKAAKEAGIQVTAEVCPHHFTLTSDDMVEGDSNYKMNPPLRTREDLEYLRKGLKEDVFEIISTDHAPHSKEEKQGGMMDAPFGIVGLETCVALTITELVKPGIITPMQMAAKMSYHPAKVIHQDNKGSLAVGKDADITIIDPDAEYVIDPSTFLSKGKNTPFGGMKVSGKVTYTLCGGNVVYKA
ncbi:MAG TPA: dihydroorotase [Candidatus Pelethocola excrementipullorum]|nr:dihydroorotase [Candidatus Pelethocola excrementipullorum]